MTSRRTPRARQLRQQQTEAESRLWSVLRASQLSNLKFRRQYAIRGFFVDFACVSHRLVVEVDGEYHDFISHADIARQKILEQAGWTVMRFTNDEVLQDTDAVLIAMTRTLNVCMNFERRRGGKSGMCKESPKPPWPSPEPSARSLPEGEVKQ